MREYIASLRWLDYFYFIFTEPRKLVDLIRKEGREALVVSVVGLALVALADVLSASLIARQTPFFFTKITYGWILGYLVLCLEVLALGFVLDGACQLAGHAGSAKSMLTTVAFALFPRALLLPAIFIFRVVGFAPVFFYVLMSMALMLWSAIIIIQGISETHQVQFSRAVFIFAVPFVTVAVAVVLATVLLVMTAAGYVAAL